MGTVAGGDVGNTNGLVAFEDDAGHAGIRAEEEVMLSIHNTVDIGCKTRILGKDECQRTTVRTGRRVATTSGMAVDVLRPDFRCMGGLAV